MKLMGRVAAAKHEEHAEARRGAILSSALQVFARNGFAESTMDQVAQEADLSKAALYLYFRSKDSLLQSLVERYTLLPELPGIIAELHETPPAQAVPRLAAHIWRQFRERKELARVIVREIQTSPERAKLLTAQGGMPATQSLATYLEQWMIRGEFRREHPLAAAQCLFGMLWFFLLTQELTGGRELYPLADEIVINTVTRIFLNGMATP